MAEITLKCREASTDTLTVRHSPLDCPTSSDAEIEIVASEGVTAWYLNADDARELFNWLGVWLHGGNRS